MPNITIYIPKDVAEYIALNPKFNRSAAFTKMVHRLMKKPDFSWIDVSDLPKKPHPIISKGMQTMNKMLIKKLTGKVK